jgi:shikimate kinase
MNISKYNKFNIVLVGMPGSGKSTVGVLLARVTSRDFLDTDDLIRTTEQRSLQDIVNSEGYQALRSIEEQILLALDCRGHVIATGGSAVYSQAAMARLRSNGVIVFLDADLPTLESRIDDFSTRGLAKGPDQTFGDLFRERFALYTQYADITVACVRRTPAEVCAGIIDELASRLEP